MKIIDYTGSAEGLLDIVITWKNECNYNEFNMDRDVPTFLKSLQDIIDCRSLFVLADEEKIIGVLGMVIFNSPIGKDVIANEHFWYVLPDYRGLGGVRLLKRGISWAKTEGCTHIMLNASCLASDLHDEVCQLYERIGLNKFETTYVKEI